MFLWDYIVWTTKQSNNKVPMYCSDDMKNAHCILIDLLTEEDHSIFYPVKQLNSGHSCSLQEMR